MDYKPEIMMNENMAVINGRMEVYHGTHYMPGS